MYEQMKFTYENYDNPDMFDSWDDGQKTFKVESTIVDDMNLGDILSKFITFLKASGFEYVRVYEEKHPYDPHETRWVIDKKIWEEYGATRL